MSKRDPMCICCCRPRSRHNNKMQCPETSYFIENDLSDVAPKPTPPERAKALEEAARVADHYAQCDRDHGFPSERAEEIAAAIRALSASPTEGEK